MALRVGLIGFGSIGRAVHAALQTSDDYALCALTRTPIENAPDGLTRVETLDALLATRPDLIVECAGHAAVRAHAAAILAADVSLIIASLGALADQALATEIEAAAQASRGQVIYPSGAIGGLDMLRAVAAAGEVTVRYQGIKPPVAWKGSPAETLVDLSGLTQRTTFFEGSGRAAARNFPKNANVVAALALAGAGFDAMRVELVAEPDATGNTHQYSVTSPVSTFQMSIVNAPSAGNARTSMATVLSILHEVRMFAQGRRLPPGRLGDFSRLAK